MEDLFTEARKDISTGRDLTTGFTLTGITFHGSITANGSTKNGNDTANKITDDKEGKAMITKTPVPGAFVICIPVSSAYSELFVLSHRPNQ